jgi:hypothetical protein
MKRITLFAALLCSSCSTVQLNYEPFACSTLVPKSWAERIAGEPLPDEAYLDDFYNSNDPARVKLAAELEKRDWQKAFVGQSFRLSMSQGRAEDTMLIIKECESKQTAAAKKIEKKWWEFWK